MTRSLLRCALAFVCFLAIANSVDVPSASAADCGHPVNRLDLFYNYYVGPGTCGYGVPAKLYVAPRPTPPWVGHTYMTYQPLMPHEFLYKHHRTYVRNHPDGTATRATVLWY